MVGTARITFLRKRTAPMILRLPTGLCVGAAPVSSLIMNATTHATGFSLPLVRGQVVGIGGADDENGEQTRWFGSTRVFADGVIRAGRLGPVLARVEHLRLAVIHLASDRTREYVAGDEGGLGVVMRR